jgi:hypothetical protein
MGKITPTDTHDTFMGSGALSYAWWLITETTGSDLDPADDWTVTVREYDPDHDKEGDKLTTFDHKALTEAVNTLARTAEDKKPKGMHPAVLRECRTFIADPEDADFDADAADQVMQYVAFGEVVYG